MTFFLFRWNLLIIRKISLVAAGCTFGENRAFRRRVYQRLTSSKSPAKLDEYYDCALKTAKSAFFSNQVGELT